MARLRSRAEVLRDKGLRVCLCVEADVGVVIADAAPGAGRTHKAPALSTGIAYLGSRRMSTFTTSARGLTNTIISG